jgi:hypothetical protein
MKELATLALVILPVGMTILEILAAAGDASPQEQHGGDGDDRKGNTVLAAETTRASASLDGRPHVPRASTERLSQGVPRTLGRAATVHIDRVAEWMSMGA